MEITNWEEAGSENDGAHLAWKGARPTSQATFLKEGKLITWTTYYVPDTGLGSSNS